jgi:hypothetical protein
MRCPDGQGRALEAFQAQPPAGLDALQRLGERVSQPAGRLQGQRQEAEGHGEQLDLALFLGDRACLAQVASPASRSPSR